MLPKLKVIVKTKHSLKKKINLARFLHTRSTIKYVGESFMTDLTTVLPCASNDNLMPGNNLLKKLKSKEASLAFDNELFIDLLMLQSIINPGQPMSDLSLANDSLSQKGEADFLNQENISYSQSVLDTPPLLNIEPNKVNPEPMRIPSLEEDSHTITQNPQLDFPSHPNPEKISQSQQNSDKNTVHQSQDQDSFEKDTPREKPVIGPRRDIKEFSQQEISLNQDGALSKLPKEAEKLTLEPLLQEEIKKLTLDPLLQIPQTPEKNEEYVPISASPFPLVQDKMKQEIQMMESEPEVNFISLENPEYALEKKKDSLLPQTQQNRDSLGKESFSLKSEKIQHNDQNELRFQSVNLSHNQEIGHKEETLTLEKLSPTQMRQNVIKQVSLEVSQALKQGNIDRIEIQLQPRSLGRVIIQLDIQEGHLLQMNVHSSHQQTLDLLSQGSQQLLDLLSHSGLETEGNQMNFSLTQDNSSSFFQEDNSAHSQDFSFEEPSEEMYEAITDPTKLVDRTV